ncbi:MAG: hypothetical protein JNL82_06060 [Myxococcales bacterium]|nr:hypothetical protein [Myxococcales bacterium]
MPRSSPLTLTLLLACTTTSSGDSGASGADPTTTAPATSSTSDAPVTTGETSDAPTTGETTDAPTTSTSAATTGLADTGDSTGATTGEPAFCQGWQGPDGAPFLDLHDRDGNLLQAGSALPLECGGQGLFMFGLYPEFGGFVPPGDILDVDLVVDVEGFNDNPEGHFYSAHPVGYYVACDDIIGGVYGVLPVFPFDNLDDLTALDGKPAQLHVVMPTGDEPIAVDLDVVLSVVEDDSWAFCGG